MPADRLSPLDATFLHVEDGASLMHIGSLGIYEGPAPTEADLRRAIAGALDGLPRLRQRVRHLPLAAGRPCWVDDAHFNLAYHVRRTALPAPGGSDELHRLFGRVMSTPLDHARPLWELWAVEGLDDGRWAVLTKLHHCMTDGVSGSDLITSLMDVRPDAEPGPARPWAPAPEPSGLSLAATALAERARWPERMLRRTTAALRDPRWALGLAGDAARGLGAYAGALPPHAPTSLNGPIGPHRRWRPARLRLDEVAQIRHALGATVNDVVLAVIAAGFRELLIGRGEAVDRPLRTLVPVSVRARDEHGVYDNKVSAIFAELPVDTADPVQRVLRVSAQMRELKEAHEAQAGEALTALSGFAPEVVLLLGGKIGTRLPQRSINTVTTNVPGPRTPLYLAKRRMLEAFPYVPLGGHVRIGVAIYSYDGRLGFGVTGDYDTAADIDVLCAAIEDDGARLLAACPAPHDQLV